jgi:CubicO group peptidase (beta-lactamase class C family)
MEPVSKAPGIMELLETLIKSQSTDGKSVSEVLVNYGTPIVSVAVMDNGDITASKIIGSTESFDNDTLFQAASISKPMTALAVIKLCQEGKLNLDAPISKYLSAEQLSWISTTKTFPIVSQISLRLLLSHTSGLSTHGFMGYPTSRIPDLTQMFRGDPPANNEPITLSILPGQKFSYSGGGFLVIQLILETYLQKPFWQLMDEIVLQPLKMTRSTFQFLPDGENYAPSYANGKNKSEPDHHLLPEKAAAGLWTTPSDLLLAVRAVQRSLELDDFLEQKWAKIMLTVVEETPYMALMALGWMKKKDGSHFGHGGDNYPGYFGFVFGYADLPSSETDEAKPKKETQERKTSTPKHCGISVMTSSALGHLIRDKILEAVAYLNGWPAVSDNPVVPFMDRAKEIDGRAKEWRGIWGPGKWSLEDANGGLSLQYKAFPVVALVPAAISSHTYDEGSSIDLVADGLEMMLRLGWKDGSQIIEIWQDGATKTLEKSKDDS